MRIISGIHKGRRFNPPVNNSFTRPTMDMAKEGLFNILANHFDFEDISILDLFGGTGSISFEFLSRGCQNVTIVEMNSALIRFINDVSISLKTQDQLKIVREDALKYLKKTDNKFDIIFADPPYEYRHYNEIKDINFSRNILSEEGLLILEHDRTHDFSKDTNFKEVRIYGTNRFSFFSH